jgi:DNA modification methylase
MYSSVASRATLNPLFCNFLTCFVSGFCYSLLANQHGETPVKPEQDRANSPPKHRVSSCDIYTGDCRNILTSIPSDSFHCCVTSPPYFGLRDYGHSQQMGLEDSPSAFVAELVSVFREVRRVLRNDGTLWLNLGDSYAYGARGGHPTVESSGLEGGHKTQLASMVRRKRQAGFPSNRVRSQEPICGARGGLFGDMKSKDLMGIPWMVAFALRADGWYLRQDIIWSKPNAMPESVTDRCTKAHEYLFLLTKSERYYYDSAAIREDRTSDENANGFRGGSYKDGAKDNGTLGKRRLSGNLRVPATGEAKYGRNKRSVWTVATAPFSDGHFATFPPALVEPCIKAGSPRSGVVLDPFGGAGTTGLVADRLQRKSVLIELNPEYVALARYRLSNDAGMFGLTV